MTTAGIRGRLAEFVLGALPAVEQAEVEAWLDGHPEGWAQVAALADAWTALALAEPAATPRRAARARLLAAAEPRPRLADFVAPVARFLDSTLEAARAVLALLDDAAAWLPAPVPGVALCDVAGGPALAEARVGLVRVGAGVHFPRHTHLGAERVLVLQGALRDDAGRILGPGATLDSPTGSAHAFTALDGPDLVFLVALFGGLDLPGFH